MSHLGNSVLPWLCLLLPLPCFMCFLGALCFCIMLICNSLFFLLECKHLESSALFLSQYLAQCRILSRQLLYKCLLNQSKNYGMKILFIFLNLFYFWLCWVLMAVCGLSLVVASRGYSLVAACGLLLLRSMRLYSVGSVVVVHGLSHPTACGIFPDLESFEPLSPELAGWFLTTEPPGKSLYLKKNTVSLCY